jgi:hypothetical protein
MMTYAPTSPNGAQNGDVWVNQTTGESKTYAGGAWRAPAAGGQMLAADGLVGAPSISFASEPTTGFYRPSAAAVALSIGGTIRHYWNGGLYWNNSDAAQINLGAAQDVTIYRDAADALALRRLANPQAFRVYNTTDAGLANYERLAITWSGNTAYITIGVLGTGVARPLVIDVTQMYFYTGGVQKWTIGAAGHFLTGTDNTYDIGSAGALRPRNLYIAGLLTLPGAAVPLLTTTTTITTGAGVGGGTLLNAPAAGNPTKWIPIDDAGVARFIPAW